MGTALIVVQQSEPTVEMLVTQFNGFGKVAAKHLILRFETVAKAKNLEYEGFREFCRQVGLDPKSSTCRKYQIIGAEADWLLEIADSLPPNWTTIFDVAVLGQDVARELVRDGRLHPEVAAAKLKAALTAQVAAAVVTDRGEAERSDTVEPCIFKIDARGLSDQDRLALHQELEEAAEPYGLIVEGLSDRLVEMRIEREAV